MSKVTSFLRDVRVEMSKVTWPSRQLTIKYTVIVIAMSLVVALFLGALDTVFKWLLEKLVL